MTVPWTWQKTIESLSDGIEYQMIFFAGPAWIAGSEVKLTNGRAGADVTIKGKKYEWKLSNGGRRLSFKSWI